METFNEDRAVQPRNEFRLMAGILGPPLVWLLQFQIKYSLAARTTLPSRLVVIATSLVALGAVAVCALSSLRSLRRAEASPLDQFARKGQRIRFMATLGVMFSGLFFLVIAAQLLADIFIKAGLH